MKEPAPRVTLVNKSTPVHTGIGRYARMLADGLSQIGVYTTVFVPDAPPLPSPIYGAGRSLGMDLQAFLRNYPIWSRYPLCDITHFTTQTLATMLMARPPAGRSVVTVHDILPHLLRNDPVLNTLRNPVDRAFYRLAMQGLKRADALLADSAYTRDGLVREFGIAEHRISVVPLGIDAHTFRPLNVDAAMRGRFNLHDEMQVVLVVGSEDPRKNLDAMLGAMLRVRVRLPNAILIKVGRSHFADQRQRLIARADALGLGAGLRFLDDVSEADLVSLYNCASVCAIPSRYEGFGLPVLEAMACGTPVVCADAASLPEVAGDAALLADVMTDADQHLADALIAVLADPARASAMRTAGRARALRFGWDACARATVDVYERVLGMPAQAGGLP